MNRRRFVRELAGYSALSIAAIPALTWLSSCGATGTTGPTTPAPGTTGTPPPSPSGPGDPVPTGTPGASCPNGTAGDVPSDRNHRINVPREDVLAGAPRTYHIQGIENHDHT